MEKETIENPRYPHQVRIIRKVYKNWYGDESGHPLEGSVAEYDGDLVEVVIYDGCGRSYTDTTTTGDARVDSNKRKASIPVRFDQWASRCASRPGELHPEGPMIPMSGDILYVTKGHIGEEWEVKDFEPDNDRSVIYGEMNRNYNIE